jgi:small subunit ribosomal protein S6
LATSDYELVLMLDPQAADEQRDKVAADTKARLESSGTLNHESVWGLRKMAYEIEQRGEADYRYYRFSGEKPLLDELDHNLKITDGVLRFRVFKVDPDSPIIEPPDTELIMRRDEEDDRGRGRGRRDDRGGRRSRQDADGGGEPAASADAGQAS